MYVYLLMFFIWVVSGFKQEARTGCYHYTGLGIRNASVEGTLYV